MGIKHCPLCSSDVAGPNAAEVESEYTSMVKKAQAAETLHHAVDRAVRDVGLLVDREERERSYTYDDELDEAYAEIRDLTSDLGWVYRQLGETRDVLSSALRTYRGAFRDDRG